MLGIHFEINTILKGKTSKQEVEILKSYKEAAEKAEQLTVEIKSQEMEVTNKENIKTEVEKSLQELQEYYSGNFIILKDSINKLREENDELKLLIQERKRLFKSRLYSNHLETPT